MRFTQFYDRGERRLGVLHGESTVVDLAGIRRAIAVAEGLRGARLNSVVSGPALREAADLFALGDEGRRLVTGALDWLDAQPAAIRAELEREGVVRDAAALEFAPAASPDATIYCVGFNYAAHAAEAGVVVPGHPELFMRGYDSIVGHGQSIIRPAVSEMLDFEVELAVIIGRPCHRVTAAEARAYVGAYANFNEGSIRDYQKHTSVPTAGKNFPASGAMGPWIVTADEVPDPHSLAISTTIDGEVMQSASTDDLIFDVDQIVAYISEFAHLQPGDVIATGTPSGIGFRREPKRFLKPGETVTVEVAGLGKLVNPIRDEVEGD